MQGSRTRRRASGRTVYGHQCARDGIEGVGGEEVSRCDLPGERRAPFVDL